MIDKIRVLLKDDRVRELIRYVIIGGFTTAVNYAALWVLFYKLSIDYNVSNAVAIFLSVVFAYIANKLVVFRSHTRNARSLAREAGTFFASRAVTMTLEWGTLFLIHTPFGVDEQIYGMYTKIGVNVIVLIINFILSKKVVFRK